MAETFHCDSDHPAAQFADCKMPIQEINVYLPSGWGPFSYEQTKLAWERGLKLWTDVVDLKFNLVRDKDLAHINPSFGPIPGSTLGWSYFPCPWRPPIPQKYDSLVSYSLEVPGRNGFSLPLLIAHEVGHALGLPHTGRGNIMNATIINNLTKAGPSDRAMLLDRYPATDPSPPDDPTPPPTPPEEPMGKLLQCLVTSLPVFFGCLFKAEQDAREAGEESPIEALVKLFGKSD